MDVLFPAGISLSALRKELIELKKGDVDPSSGRVFAYVYTRDSHVFQLSQEVCDWYDGDSEQHSEKEAITKEFFNAFLHDNALNPTVFPSLLWVSTCTYIPQFVHSFVGRGYRWRFTGPTALCTVQYVAVFYCSNSNIAWISDCHMLYVLENHGIVRRCIPHT